MKIALLHYYLISVRGGERVFHTLAQTFPSADLFAVVHDPSSQPEWLKTRNLHTSFVDKLPGSWKYFRQYFPLYPHGIESFDFSSYDVVISSAAGWTLGALTSPQTLHICYCHTPLRYVWTWYHRFIQDANPILRPLLSLMLHHVRIWDQNAAQRVDYFVANSCVTQQRIRKFYNRESVVIPPPINTDRPEQLPPQEPFYLVVSELVPYKKVNVIIETFNQLGQKLVIVGDGSQRATLRSIAKPNITFLGRASDKVLSDHYARCKALVFIPEEDFGMVPLEAHAWGKPVIAYGVGGALETVIEGETGTFFAEQSSASLAKAIARFEQMDFDAHKIRLRAQQFDTTVFQQRIRSFVNNKLSLHRAQLGLPPLALN